MPTRYVRKSTDPSQSSPLKSNIEKEGKITEVLSRGDFVLAQIEKVPISQKGPRISCEISLAGRYLILSPFNQGISISRRISSAKERSRLMRLVETICPKNFGIIVRTAAEGVSAAEFHKDLKTRLDAWKAGLQQLQGADERQRIIGEAGRSTLLLRDMLSDELEALYTDKEALYKEVRQYIRNISPGKEKNSAPLRR